MMVARMGLLAFSSFVTRSGTYGSRARRLVAPGVLRMAGPELSGAVLGAGSWRIGDVRRRFVRGRLVQGGCPTGQQVEGVLGWRPRLGGVDEHGEVLAGQLHCLEGQLEVPDDRVAELLVPGAVEADVVGCPPRAERLTLGRELANQIGEGLIVG